MRSSFDYFLKVGNAAIHGQTVPENYAAEALHMGLQILKELSSLAPE